MAAGAPFISFPWTSEVARSWQGGIKFDLFLVSKRPVRHFLFYRIIREEVLGQHAADIYKYIYMFKHQMIWFFFRENVFKGFVYLLEAKKIQIRIRDARRSLSRSNHLDLKRLHPWLFKSRHGANKTSSAVCILFHEELFFWIASEVTKLVMFRSIIYVCIWI